MHIEAAASKIKHAKQDKRWTQSIRENQRRSSRSIGDMQHDRGRILRTRTAKTEKKTTEPNPRQQGLARCQTQCSIVN